MSWVTWIQATLQLTLSVIIVGAGLAIAVGLIISSILNSIRGGKS